MKRLIAALSFAVIALPAAAIEHGGPWEVNETRAPQSPLYSTVAKK